MKLAVCGNTYRKLSLDEALMRYEALGITAVEIGAGGYPGKDHCNPAELLADEDKYRAFMATLAKHPNMTVAALSAHGNPVHPNKAIATEFDADFRNAVLLAEKMGIDTIVTFSGCPGDCEGAMYPNWVTCSWPPDYLKILEYQWNEVLIPYWKDAAAFAEAHGVTRIALEMHPGFSVYNPATLLRLREAVGPAIGANLDPSHLFWQGIDPIAAARELRGAIYHVHAKDTKIDPYNNAKNGVLDIRHYSDEAGRSWVFRTVGYGHDRQFWCDFVSNLRLCGYDRVLSIEHEDSYMTLDEGLAKAAAFLQEVMIAEPKPTEMAWA